MESKKKILVIINPISGSAHREYMPEVVKRNLDANLFDICTRFTQGPGHATEMAKKAIEQEFDGVVAIGGDGTINETASALINSPIALGIVPCGSGNGLARHFGIPSTQDYQRLARRCPRLLHSKRDTLLLHLWRGIRRHSERKIRRSQAPRPHQLCQERHYRIPQLPQPGIYYQDPRQRHHRKSIRDSMR